MSTFRINATGVAGMHFALSPLAELVSQLFDSYLTAAEGSEWGWLRVDPVASGLFDLITHTGEFPDIVTVPPVGMNTDLGDELAQMRAYDEEAVQHSLASSYRHSWAHGDRSWLQTPHLIDRIANVFERAWTVVAPDWPRRRAIMERDIRYRAGLLATHGWPEALSGMGRSVRWLPPDGLQFSTRFHEREVPIEDAGLVFVPHTVGRGRWVMEAPPLFAICYTARGVADEPQPSGTARSLVGQTRARILDLLEAPSTPSQLAVVLGCSLGTVAQHLTKLEQANTISRTRIGRHVFYERTTRGDQLVLTFR